MSRGRGSGKEEGIDSLPTEWEAGCGTRSQDSGIMT